MNRQHPQRTTPCILLVDDFDDAREMYEAYLRFRGFATITAADALEALHLAKEHRPDLILMDAGLPGMSGWEAVEALKADPELRQIPVVMLTGHVLVESRREAERVGADGFIGKPCLPDDLVSEVKRVLGSNPPPKLRRSKPA